MRILIVGAGAVGGYFGARLAEAGRDVTFLVRPGREAKIAASGGLVVKSPVGDFTVAQPKLVRADTLKEKYDLVFLTCKAYDLDSCIRDIAPAVGDATMILPALNGMRHMDVLTERFGAERVLGGRVLIFATTNEDGHIIHQAPGAVMDYGEMAGGVSERINQVDAQMSNAGFTAHLQEDIVQRLWDKWVLIAANAGSTGLMRAAFGTINKAGGLPFMKGLLEETASVAEYNGHRPSDEFLAGVLKSISDPESPQKASLAKDMDKGGRIEADQIFGDMLARAEPGSEDRLVRLSTVYAALKAYEIQMKYR